MSLQFNHEIRLPMALTNYLSMSVDLEARTVVTMKIPVSWVVTPSSLEEIY